MENNFNKEDIIDFNELDNLNYDNFGHYQCIICNKATYKYHHDLCKKHYNQAILEFDFNNHKKTPFSKILQIYFETYNNLKYKNLADEEYQNNLLTLVTLGRHNEYLVNRYKSDIFYLKYLYKHFSQNENIDTDIINFRKKFPTKYRCDDGHYVRSKAEIQIDNYLYNNKFLHVYEKLYTDSFGNNYYPDFYLPQFNLFIEYFGRNDEKYNNKVKLKKHIYENDENYNFVYLSYHDDEILTEKLESYILSQKRKQN